MSSRSMGVLRYGVWVPGIILLAAVMAPVAARTARTASVPSNPADEQVLRGRSLVMEHDCGGCHGGHANPASPGYLSGWRDSTQTFFIGPFKTYPRNLTPDNATGTGRFTERQIFNALRYGLRPGETPDVDITSSVPGQGNFPAIPKYLAPPMPWVAFRYMSDQQLKDIAAYLKRGLKPVVNRVTDSEGPPDFWASEYTVEKYGSYPVAAYPTVNEQKVP